MNNREISSVCFVNYLFNLIKIIDYFKAKCKVTKQELII